MLIVIGITALAASLYKLSEVLLLIFGAMLIESGDLCVTDGLEYLFGLQSTCQGSFCTFSPAPRLTRRRISQTSFTRMGQDASPCAGGLVARPSWRAIGRDPCASEGPPKALSHLRQVAKMVQSRLECKG